jgi:peptidoglycan/LPS O-acetylase OafA/YrhL
MEILQSTWLLHACGWVGAICVLLAYFLISLGKVNNNNMFYHLLNLLGAVLLIYNTVVLKAYPSAFVNVVWTFIAIAGLWKGRK